MKSGELAAGLLARARAGDAHAFRLLYDHHADAVFAFLFRLLHDQTGAEDALQEVFVRVFDALSRFDPVGPAKLSTWIFTIARRVALTAIERAQVAGRQASDVPLPDAHSAQHDLRLGLQAAVAALPEAMRTTFVLRECCQLSYDEVAAIEGIDIGTVKSRLHRARASLQASLADDADQAATRTPERSLQTATQERHRHEARAAKA